MGKYTFEYDAINDLANEFLKMDASLKSEITETAREIGSQLKNNVSGILSAHRTKEPKHGTYFSDEVRMRVNSSDKRTVITVSGGKQTGPLWWTVDNGHVAKNGKFVPGIHFTDTAYGQTDVTQTVDRMIQRVTKNE